MIAYLEQLRREAARTHELLTMLHYLRPMKEKPKPPRLLKRDPDLTRVAPT